MSKEFNTTEYPICDFNDCVHCLKGKCVHMNQNECSYHILKNSRFNEIDETKNELALQIDGSIIIPTKIVENLYGKNSNIVTFSIEITEDAETGELGFAIFPKTKKEV